MRPPPGTRVGPVGGAAAGRGGSGGLGRASVAPPPLGSAPLVARLSAWPGTGYDYWLLWDIDFG